MPTRDPDSTAPNTPASRTPREGGEESPPAGGTVVGSPEHVARLEARVRTEVVHVDGYDVFERLGAGGMGSVYRARHRALNREVALKVLLGDAPGRGALLRFLAEAEAVAAVDHENVVRVYDYGESAGRPYLALEYCSGGSSVGRLRGRDPASDPRPAAELLARIARGVAAAHALGIVHRDLKPENVLLDATGVPKVADFGLAKRGTGAALTRADQLMGTPAYMSPEQADGAAHVGPPTDVWALGVMLYAALAGRRPFEGTDPEVLAAVRVAEPAPVRRSAPAVPRDLELICHKCLSRAPHERYPTARTGRGPRSVLAARADLRASRRAAGARVQVGAAQPGRRRGRGRCHARLGRGDRGRARVRQRRERAGARRR